MQPFSPSLSTLADAIQLSLSPAFVLAGIGTLINVMTGRLARVVDRVRVLEALLPASEDAERARYVQELRVLDRRITIVNVALMLLVSSAVFICTVVAMLFVAELARLHIGRYVAAVFIGAMALLTASLLCFIREVHVSLRAVRVRAELMTE